MTFSFLEKKSPAFVFAFGVLIIATISIIDYYTGEEIAFSIFYIFPISIVSLYSNTFFSILTCFIAGAIWFAIEYATGAHYSHYGYVIWHAIVRFGFFLITSNLLIKNKHLLDRLQKLATIDGLTGLLNSRSFKEISQNYCLLSARYQRPIAIGYIDVDNFKGINDTLGHSVGDQVLSSVAKVLKESVRTTDVVGRLGGDEFAVFLPEANYQGTKELFEKIHSALVQNAKTNQWPIGFSVGVAIFPVAPVEINNALKVADNLMYKVKKSCKNKLLLEEQPQIPENVTKKLNPFKV
jgi:diguanylate cyclase (GGDEF)-like protein